MAGPVIIDACLYDGEWQLLAARIAEIGGVVDAHVAVRANRTHQGIAVEPSPEAGEIALGGGAAAVVVADLSPYDTRGRGGVGTPDYSVRERAHRDQIVPLLDRLVPARLPDDAVLLLSDVDEIPTAEAVQRAALFVGQLGPADDPNIDRARSVCVLEQRMHAFALDWLHPQTWLGTTACRLGWARRHGCQEMRDSRGHIPQLPDGGWHLSWLGGPAAWRRKLDSFSHAEIAKSDAELLACWRNGVDVNGTRMAPIEIGQGGVRYPALLSGDDTLPSWWLRPRNEKA